MTRKELFIRDVLDGDESQFDPIEYCCKEDDPESPDFIPGLPLTEPRCCKCLRCDAYKSCEECWNQPIDLVDYFNSKGLTNGVSAKMLAGITHIDPAPSVIPGLDPNVPIATNANGGKQSSTPYGFHLLPTSSIFAAAEVAAYGANKYGEDFHNRNYVKIPVEDHINHAIQHLYGYLAGDTSDDHLGHAIVRTMFAYDVAHRTKER